MLEAFNNLTPDNHEVTSDEDVVYNCIAWAAGRDATDGQWWWPAPEDGFYWPDDAPLEETTAAFIEAFRTLGYEECENGHLEPEVEKVALYGEGDKPKHMARQLENGTWTSKLGRYHDIVHQTVEAVENDVYGNVKVYLRCAKPR